MVFFKVSQRLQSIAKNLAKNEVKPCSTCLKPTHAMLFFIALPMALPKTRNPSIPNLSLCSRSGTELKLSAHLYVRPESFRQKCAKGVESPILTI